MRLSAIGDVIHGLPVLCALRASMPGAYLAWAVEGRAGDLLEGHPALDELVRLRRRFWKSPLELIRLRNQLSALEFDVTIDLQCLSKSAVAAWLSGAPRRIGKAGEHARELSRLFNNESTETGGEHVIEHYLSMLRPLGIESPAVRFDLPEFVKDANMVEAFLRQQNLAGRRFAVLNPGAGWPSKIWPAVRYAGLARYLGQTHGVPSVVVWGTPEEKKLAQHIFEFGARHAIMAPASTMRELAAICRRASLFVGSDTGPMHLAVAVGTPTISLHGTSRADWCGAYGPSNIRLQVRYQDGTAHERRKAENSAMREISVKMVAAACDQLLTRSAARQVG